MKVSQAERKEAKAESDSALERLRVTMADHNAKVAEYHAKMAEQSKDIIKFIATMSGISVAVLGAFIALLQFYK